MFNAAKFEALYTVALQATIAHRTANGFAARATAREAMDEAQTLLARMQKSKRFDVDMAALIATRLKAEHATAH